jgi:hypothetical protein
MTDWSGALARAFHNHLDFSGSSGSSGSGNENSNVVRWLRERTLGTASGEAVIPVVPAGSGIEPMTAARGCVPVSSISLRPGELPNRDRTRM